MTHINRNVKESLLSLLKESPVVFLNGPRQAGKSTLVHNLSQNEFPAEYVTFDNTTQMAAAAHSPESYLTMRKGPLIIDEVQLVPEIFRALKLVVDDLRKEANPVGRFLLTGSANIMALPRLSDALVGRMRILTLYPLAGAEITGGTGMFLDHLFNQDFTKGTEEKVTKMIQVATFPEVSQMKEGKRWFDAYLTTILQRDIRALAEIEKLSTIPNLLRILAARAGNLLNDAEIARDAGLTAMTSKNYRTLVKMLFITFDISPWYRNIGKRLVKSPKTLIRD